MPALKEQSDRAHARGKYLATHTDGENTGLMELYLKSGFDIADSICPAPMTKISRTPGVCSGYLYGMGRHSFYFRAGRFHE
ncbi:MAG: hypothetical protein ACLRMZ_09005 [Blautia marasmi]